MGHATISIHPNAASWNIVVARLQCLSRPHPGAYPRNLANWLNYATHIIMIYQKMIHSWRIIRQRSRTRSKESSGGYSVHWFASKHQNETLRARNQPDRYRTSSSSSNYRKIKPETQLTKNPRQQTLKKWPSDADWLWRFKDDKYIWWTTNT